MQLWENLLEINGLTLRLMQYQTDIRANYVVCLCGLLVRAGSMAVIHFFTVFLVWGKWLDICHFHVSFDLKGQTGVLHGPSEFI